MYTIIRTYHPEATTGVMLDSGGQQLCVTLERPWLDNKKQISCIPEGTYSVITFQSPSKGDVWLIQNVLDRDMIEIHACNYVEQLLGCIGVGNSLKENIPYRDVMHRYWISNSQATMKFLKKTLPTKFLLELRK